MSLFLSDGLLLFSVRQVAGTTPAAIGGVSPSRYCRVTQMHGSVNVSILYVLMFCDIGSDGMDSTVLNSSRAGQFLKRLKELVWNSAF